MPATFTDFPINRRAQVALELYTTERSYVRGLETILQVRHADTTTHASLLKPFSFKLKPFFNIIHSLRDRPQCFRQTVPLRESRVAIREGPQKNGERANLALYFYKAAGRLNPGVVF